MLSSVSGRFQHTAIAPATAHPPATFLLKHLPRPAPPLTCPVLPCPSHPRPHSPPGSKQQLQDRPPSSTSNANSPPRTTPGPAAFSPGPVQRRPLLLNGLRLLLLLLLPPRHLSPPQSLPARPTLLLLPPRHLSPAPSPLSRLRLLLPPRHLSPPPPPSPLSRLLLLLSSLSPSPLPRPPPPRLSGSRLSLPPPPGLPAPLPRSPGLPERR